MKDLVNIAKLPTVDILSQYSTGSFRFIVKCRAGYLTCSDALSWDHDRLMKNPESCISSHVKGALQAVEFKPEGSDYWFTIFARVGKKIKVIDKSILLDTTVGTINSMWYNTELYSQDQYRAVNSESWASYAYRMNEPKYEMA